MSSFPAPKKLKPLSGLVRPHMRYVPEEPEPKLALAPPRPGAYRVTVDTTLGLAGLIGAVEADGYVNSNITNPDWSPPAVPDKGAYVVDIELAELPSAMTTSESLSWLDAQGFRPAMPEEALAVCAAHKDIQRKSPIICLGFFWVSPDGDPHALVLSGHSRERSVHLDWYAPEVRWGARCRVAVVRK